MTTYKTHDNGGRPFEVTINSPTNVTVKTKYDEPNCKTYEFDGLTEIFIGKCHTFPNCDGNSILLHLKDNKYIFIGRYMFEFTSLGKILSLESPIFGSDVAYPFSRDDAGNLYMFIEDVVILNNQITCLCDPYRIYYDGDIYPFNMWRGKLYKTVKYKNLHMVLKIKKFLINEISYGFAYMEHPEIEYDKITKAYGTPMHIIDENNKKIVVDKAKFCELMAQIENHYQFKSLNKRMIHNGSKEIKN